MGGQAWRRQEGMGQGRVSASCSADELEGKAQLRLSQTRGRGRPVTVAAASCDMICVLPWTLPEDAHRTLRVGDHCGQTTATARSGESPAVAICSLASGCSPHKVM